MTHRTLRLAAALCLGGAILGLTACESTDKTDEAASQPGMGVINTMCAVQPDHAVAEGSVAMFESHEIGFCCDDCMGAFEAWPDEKKAGYVKEQMAAGE